MSHRSNFTLILTNLTFKFIFNYKKCAKYRRTYVDDLCFISIYQLPKELATTHTSGFFRRSNPSVSIMCHYQRVGSAGKQQSIWEKSVSSFVHSHFTFLLLLSRSPIFLWLACVEALSINQRDRQPSVKVQHMKA